MKARDKGRGVLYSRDSGGKHEMTPAQYVEWAAREASKLEIRFTGTTDDINELIRTGEPVKGDIFFDYCVSGNEMSRPALDALRASVKQDSTISHIFVPRRDRLARPNDPEDAVRLEKDLRKQGVTIVLTNRVLPPLNERRRTDLAEELTAYIEYDHSGRFREDLAEKMINAQLQLAKRG